MRDQDIAKVENHSFRRQRTVKVSYDIKVTLSDKIIFSVNNPEYQTRSHYRYLFDCFLDLKPLL